MFYYGVPIEDIKRFYKGKEQQYLFDTALMQLESEGMIKREGESFVVTKEAGHFCVMGIILNMLKRRGDNRLIMKKQRFWIQK